MHTPTKSKKLKKPSFAVDFQSVSLSSLKKYRRQYHIRVKPTAPKGELAAAIAEHFASIPVPEEEVAISGFLQAVQKNRQARLAEDEEESVSSHDKDNKVDTPSPFKAKNKKQSERTQPASSVKNVSQSNTGSAVKKTKRESKKEEMA